MAEVDMDFHGMKRKQLQALCKKHGIPANKTNREMADRLASALKVNESPCSQNIDEGEIVEEDDTEALRQPKRVRFSPEVETREYEPTACKQKGRVTRSRAKFQETRTEDEISKNLEEEAFPVKSPHTLRNGRRKLVQECVVPEELRGRAKRNTPKSIDSESMITEGSKSCEVGGRITRLRGRSRSSCNTSVVNKEAKSDVPQKDCSEVITVNESADGANRYPSRRKSVVVAQSVKLKKGQRELKGEPTSKVKMVAEALADLKEDSFQKTLGPAGNMRRSRRKNVVFDTIAVVDQMGEDESVGLEEIPKQVKRNSSRQKSRILRKEKVEVADKGLKGKASKVSSNSQLEVIKDVEASVDSEGNDEVQKISAPIGNLRRSRRKSIAVPLSGTNSTIDEAEEGEVVEMEGKVIKGNFSGRSGNDLKERKRKATEQVNTSKLEVISVETKQEFEDNISFQKAPVPTSQLRRSMRKTVMFSSLTTDGVVENLKTGGSLWQFSEQASGNDVQPIDESLGQPEKFSRHSSRERRETTDAVDQVVPRSQRGKRVRDVSPMVKRESVAAKQKHADCLSVSTIDDNKSTDDIIINVLMTSINKCAADTQEKMEEPQSATPSKLVGGSTHQGLPSESAIDEKTLAQTAKEKNVDFVIDSTGEGVYLVPAEREDANSTPISSASKFSEKMEPSISELPIAQEEATVNFEVSSSKGPTADSVNSGLTVLENPVDERYLRCSMEGSLISKLVKASMYKETPWSASKPTATNVDANPAGDNYDEAVVEYIVTEGDKVTEMFQSLDMSLELNHVNLVSETEGPEREELVTEIHHGNEDHTTGVKKKAIHDGIAEKLGQLTPTRTHKNEDASNSEKLSVDLKAEILTGRTEGNFKMDPTVLPLVDDDTTTFNSAERVLFLEQDSGAVPHISKENPANALSVTGSAASEGKDIIKDGTHSTAYVDLKSPGIACTVSHSKKKHPQVICQGDGSLFSVDASKRSRSTTLEEKHHISSATRSDNFKVKAVEMEKVPPSDAFAINLGTSGITANTAGEHNLMHYDQNANVKETERKLLLNEPQSFIDSKLETRNDTRDGAAEMLTELMFLESETSEQESGNLTITDTVHINSHEIVNEGEPNEVIPDSQVEFLKADDAAIGSISRILNVGFQRLNDIDARNNLKLEVNLTEHQEIKEGMELQLERGDFLASKSPADVNEEAVKATENESSEQTILDARTFNVVKALDGMCDCLADGGGLSNSKDVAASMHDDLKTHFTQVLRQESETYVGEKTQLMINEYPLMNTMAVLNQGETISGMKDSRAQRISKQVEDSVVKDSAQVLDTNEDRDFCLDDDVNELGKNCRSSELYEVQTGEASNVRSLVVPGLAFSEPVDICTEANGTYYNDISSQAIEKAVASEEDIDSSDIRAGSAIFTEWQTDLMRGNESQHHQAVESDRETKRKVEGKTPIPDMTRGTNAREVFQLPGEYGSDKLTDTEECQQAATKAECSDVSEGLSKELQNELQEAAAEDSLGGTDGLAREDDSPITTSDNASSLYNDRQEPEETEVLDNSTQSSSKATVESFNLASSGSSMVQEMESIGLHLLFEGQNGEADVAEPDQLALVSDEMSKRASASLHTTREEHIGEMKDCVSEAQGKEGETCDVLTIINTVASVDEDAPSECVTNLFNLGKECCIEGKIVNFSSDSVDEMEYITDALVSDEMSKHASSLPEPTEENTDDVKNELSMVLGYQEEIPEDITILKEKASCAAAINSFNLGKVCTPTILEEELVGNHINVDDTGELKESTGNSHATLTSNHPALVQASESGAEDKFPSSSPPQKETVICDDLLLSGKKFSSSATTRKGKSGKLTQRTPLQMFAAKEMDENVAKMILMDDCREATTETECMDVSEESIEEDSLAGTDESAINRSSLENDINRYVPMASNVYNDLWEPEEKTGVFVNSAQFKATVDSSELASNSASLVHQMESAGFDLLFERRDGEADRFALDLASEETSKETTPEQISTETYTRETNNDLNVMNTAVSMKVNAAYEAVTGSFKLGKENAGPNEAFVDLSMSDRLGPVRARKGNGGTLMMQRTTGKMFAAEEMKENVGGMSAPTRIFAGKRLPLRDLGTGDY